MEKGKLVIFFIRFSLDNKSRLLLHSLEIGHQAPTLTINIDNKTLKTEQLLCAWSSGVSINKKKET